ncbi:MAG: DMT family transporter [Capsulimonadaceae bacterium]|nr:DMT family transporter [Capsulimonadaceae bacterium]
MTSTTLGASLALATAAFWAISPFCFASASRKIGSMAVAVLRVVIAMFLLAVVLSVRVWLTKSPIHFPGAMAMTLTIASGIIGMGLGDLMGYEAFLVAGVQRTTLISTLAPVAAVIAAWLGFGETLGVRELAGIALVIAGTAFALDGRYDAKESRAAPDRKGILLAVGSAVCMGLGAVTVRWAYHYEPRLDPVVATTLRVASAAVFLTAISPLLRCNLTHAARTAGGHTWSRIVMGTLAGPFGGMLCYVTALSLISAGLCSALASASPLFVLAIAALRFRKAPTPLALFASVIAVIGVVVLMVK